MAIEEKEDLIEQIKQRASEIVKRVDALSEMKSETSYDMLLLGTLEYCDYLRHDLSSYIDKADSDLKESLSISYNDEAPF